MLIPFGILSAAGVSAAPTGAYELISTTILGSATSSVTFSSLGTYSSTYKHLQLRISTRTSSSISTGAYLALTFNGNTSNIYDSHALYGTSSSVGSNNALNYPEIYLQRTTNSTSAANAFGAMVIDVLDAYSSTKNKTVRFLSASGVGTGLFPITLGSGLWRNTNSITSVTIGADASNLISGSRLSLYGIRG